MGPYANRRARMCIGAMRSLTIALTVFTGLLWAGSILYEVTLRGSPFNHTWSASGGALRFEWLTMEANGSVSGFGNPGWSMAAQSHWSLTWLPSLNAYGTLHEAVVPLWPFPVIGVGVAWLCARLRRLIPNPHVCASCGYPRHGLRPDSPCPECGRTHHSLLARLLRLVRPPMAACPIRLART
jgi:predicted RNA-binding Zn-ribbon protein involved in translation (DUF1610 family)